jgi:hypothetical protein
MRNPKLLLLTIPLFCATALAQEDWKIHSNWCANVDNGSSHKVYLSTCASADQYDSVLACQRDAARGNGDGGKAVRAIEEAGREAVNRYMEDNKPKSCVSSYHHNLSLGILTSPRIVVPSIF